MTPEQLLVSLLNSCGHWRDKAAAEEAIRIILGNDTGGSGVSLSSIPEWADDTEAGINGVAINEFYVTSSTTNRPCGSGVLVRRKF